MSYSNKRYYDDDTNDMNYNIKKMRKKSPPSTPSVVKRNFKIISMEIDIKKTYTQEEVDKILEDALRKQKEELEQIMQKKLEEQLIEINNCYLLHNNNFYNGNDCSYIS